MAQDISEILCVREIDPDKNYIISFSRPLDTQNVEKLQEAVNRIFNKGKGCCIVLPATRIIGDRKEVVDIGNVKSSEPYELLEFEKVQDGL